MAFSSLALSCGTSNRALGAHAAPRRRMPRSDRCAIMRSTADKEEGMAASGQRKGFFVRVYEMVEQVPEGMVATYGQIAELVGEPRKARYVGFALHVNPRPGIIPCHRIVFADGSLATGFAFGGESVQREMLEAEGISFLADGRVDLAACRWPAGIE